MKFLVTGGAGFIGSHIVEKLLQQNYEVHVLDNFSTGKKENLAEFINDIQIHVGDIRNYHFVKDIMKDVEYTFHQAALSSVPRSIEDPIATNDINVSGTLNVLNAALKSGVNKVVFASSAAIYGDDPELPKHEMLPPNPKSPYALSKLFGEHYCKLYSTVYGLPTVALRYFNVFGPKQDPNSDYAAVIPKFITSMVEDVQPVIYGDGLQSRDFIFIDDVVSANIKSALSNIEGGIVMNCAGGSQITVNDLAHYINKILSKDLQPIYKEERKGDIKHSFADVSLVKEKLGFEIENSFEDGLKKTLEYYKVL